MSALFSEPITVVTVTEEVGSDGRAILTEAETQTKGAFRQRAAVDAFNDGVIVSDEVAVYLSDPAVPVQPGDRVVIRGESYEVVSTDFPQVNFRTGSVHHREVRARRSTR